MNFRISESQKSIITPFDPAITGAIPHYDVVEARTSGNQFLVIPHGITESKVMRNLGYDVPAPILTQYEWRSTKPFISQKDTACLLTENWRAYVLNDMGTGKTRASLYAADFLMDKGEVSKALIVAPLSTLNSVWESELFETFPDRTAITVFGTAAKRRKLLAMDADFYIINHDGVATVLEELLKRKDINLTIVDELTAFRTKRSKRWKALNEFTVTCKWVWGMTGAPMPKEPTDAHGQIKLITPNRMKDSLHWFKRNTMHQISPFKWVPKQGAIDKVYDLMQPSVRYTRDQCVDLPPTTYTRLDVPFSKSQRDAYKSIAAEFVLASNTPGAPPITAANAGVQFMKLMQIGCGFLYGDDKSQIEEFDVVQRIKTLRDVIERASHKVIVFAPFRHAVEMLRDELSNDFSVAMIHGGVAKAARDDIFTKFQRSTSPHVLVAHPGTMSHGLTLTAADTIVWFSPLLNLDTFIQANARVTRPGQVAHTHIVCLQGSQIERRAYSVLQKRENLQADLLDMFVNGQASLFT